LKPDLTNFRANRQNIFLDSNRETVDLQFLYKLKGKTAIDVVNASATSLMAISWAVASKKTPLMLWIISQIPTE